MYYFTKSVSAYVIEMDLKFHVRIVQFTRIQLKHFDATILVNLIQFETNA